MKKNEAIINKFLSSNDDEPETNSTKWAVLVAGSQGYENYRHQADVCHAYQLLKKNGLADENIIVFMYDDIAWHQRNPKKGFIINKPDGPNVYDGVPHDYTGDDVSPANFYAVLNGNDEAISIWREWQSFKSRS